MKIKKHILLLSALGLLSWNCNKNIEEINNSNNETISPTKLEGNLYSNISNVKEDIFFSGNSTLFSNQSFSGNMTLNKDKTEAIGKLFIDGVKVQDFVIDITEESLNSLTIIDNHNGTLTYENVVDGEPVLVSNLSENGLSASAHFDYNSLSVDFTNTKSQANSSRVIPLLAWAVGAAIVTIGTAATCAYERTAARNACQAQYQECNSRCGRSCAYLYTSGACGGTCNVQCR